MTRTRRGQATIGAADLARLKPILDRLYAQYNHADRVADPIELARRYGAPADREIAGFLAAGLAFGRVASVLRSIDDLFTVLGPSPAAFLARFDPARDGHRFDRLGHRWIRARDLVALTWILKHIVEAHGSLEALVLKGCDPAATDVGPALEAFSDAALSVDLRPVYGARGPRRAGVRYFFPKPSSGSACKRLNLFLRWMVRDDGVDFGLWTRVPASKLIVPLDTHIERLGRCLRLTRYATPGWRMAAEITASLRQIDPCDPVKYDFALCHVGMMDACGFRRSYRDERCPLRGVCRPAVRRARSSRRPSGRH